MTTEPRPTALLLLVDARVADLDVLRAAADRRGWDLEIDPADAGDGERWFAAARRIRVRAREGAEAPDADALVHVTRGLARDETRRLHD